MAGHTARLGGRGSARHGPIKYFFYNCAVPSRVVSPCSAVYRVSRYAARHRGGQYGTAHDTVMPPAIWNFRTTQSVPDCSSVTGNNKRIALQALYLAVNIYTYFAGNQISSYTYTTTSFASIGEELLLDASTVFYICLLRWNPADRTHTLRYLVRSLAASIVVSILLTAFVWSPILFQSAEPPRLSDLDKYAKRLPELRPNDMRNIPFITA